jgi:uncharacterized protein
MTIGGVPGRPPSESSGRPYTGPVGNLHYESIPMPDGVRLAVSLFLPAAVSFGERVPVLLEALPYRKDDLTAAYRPEYVRFRDEFGYAVARVDLRGTGSSTGIMTDEYSTQEQDDLVHVIDWLEAQSWSTGAIGMFGTSWSGFNALQLAKIGPPALKAVVSTYASDDRWTDDVHYMGGALRLLDLVDYPLYMVAMNALPPVPSLFGEGWHDEWTRRAQQTPAWLLTWLEEQNDAGYWRQGSVRESPLAPSTTTDLGLAQITCPTMLITGWADGYRNATFRMLNSLHGSGTAVKVLAGPWSHASPATSVPGPNVDHVPLMARWWDRWLRGVPTDGPYGSHPSDHEPPLTVFVREYAPPDPVAVQSAGHWEAHDVPSLRASPQVRLPFTSAVVSGGDVRGETALYEPVLDVGVTAWNSCAAALPWGQPQDQTVDDARSLCLSWPDLGLEGTTVIGHPRLWLRVRPDHPIAFVSAKLTLVPAAGRPSLLVDRGLINLAYRDGDAAQPRPCVPGQWVDVDLELEATAFHVSPGCELRLVLACADWPNTVAPPGTWSAIDLSSSHLVLPVSPGSVHPVPDLPAPVVEFVAGADAGDESVDPDGEDDDSWVTWKTGTDVLAGTTWAEVDHGSAYGGKQPDRHDCAEHYTGRVEIDPATGAQRLRATAQFDLSRPELEATSRAVLDITVEAEHLDVRLELDVRDGDSMVAERFWQRRIARRST